MIVRIIRPKEICEMSRGFGRIISRRISTGIKCVRGRENVISEGLNVENWSHTRVFANSFRCVRFSSTILRTYSLDTRNLCERVTACGTNILHAHAALPTVSEIGKSSILYILLSKPNGANTIYLFVAFGGREV